MHYRNFVAGAAGILAGNVVNAAPTSSTSIQWFSCPQNKSTVAPYECGSIKVPLDYTEPDVGTLTLKMVRVNHTKEPFMGTILFNTGGPGLGSRSLVAGTGQVFLNLTGGNFDLIGHDPRGTGDTIPFVCYNETERSASRASIPWSAGDSDAAPGQIFTERYFMAQACVRKQQQYGELIGTAFTARDMMQIVDALDEDGMLRYWGFSYGSALGATVAAMFPDRMDKVVIDGVVNMRQYYAGLDYEQFSKTDAAFHSFLEACVAAPDKCVLSQQGSCADEIEAKVYDLLADLRRQPLALGPQFGDVVKYSVVRVNMLTGLRQPASLWPILAKMLHSVFTGNLTAYQASSAVLGGLFEGGSWPELGASDGSSGIRCSDHSFRTNNLTDLIPVISEFKNSSRLIGDFIAAAQPMTCAQWPFKAKEQIQWTGDYKTKNPILLVGNTFDPLTPVESAFNTSADFPGSVVIHQNSGGHASLSHPSKCTNDAIRSYFVNGTLPQNGLFCEPDKPLGAFGPGKK